MIYPQRAAVRADNRMGVPKCCRAASLFGRFPRSDTVRKSKYLIPLVLLAVVGIVLWRSGIAHAVTWNSFARHQAELSAWVGAHRFLAGAAYFGLYTTLVAFSIPESAVVTIAGGLLFGTLIGGTLALLGSTLGAVIIFLVARTAFAKTVSRRARPLIRRIRPGIKRDGFSYLLALRLVPAFPFWLINLGAGAAGMRLVPYAAATLLGIIPGTFIFASIGDGVGSVLAAGGRPDVSVLFSPRVLGPLIGLAVLSLSPVILRHIRPPKRERG
jgi:uncharacterized membrane protein YdjX (TVP38/TMEM64 family)